MRKLFKDNIIWVLLAAAIVSVALALMSYFSNTSAPLTNLVNTVTAPVRSAYTAVATWFNEKQAYFQDVTALEEENAALKKQIAEMEASVRQAEKDSAENQLLRKRLNLREQRRDLTDVEAAYVTEHTVNNWTSSLTLDRGTAHGVETGDCVVDENNALVGVVSEVGHNWCTVLTLVDTDTSLGAQVFRTKDLGLAEGDFALMGDGQLRLDYLPAGCQLLAGDLVLTSGLGGYYPSGLVIGTVDSIQKDDAGAASYAVLTPQTDLDALSEVFIIKSFDIVT